MAVAQTCRLKAGLRTSRRKSGTNRLFYCVAEHVNLGESRVNIRRDSDALEFFVLDRCDDDSIALPQMTDQLGGFDAFDAEIGQAARLQRIVRRQDSNP